MRRLVVEVVARGVVFARRVFLERGTGGWGRSLRSRVVRAQLLHLRAQVCRLLRRLIGLRPLLRPQLSLLRADRRVLLRERRELSPQHSLRVLVCDGESKGSTERLRSSTHTHTECIDRSKKKKYRSPSDLSNVIETVERKTKSVAVTH